MRLVFIGGVGGSGTRVVANIFRENGIFIGSNLNESLDNLDWPGLRDEVKNQTLSFDEKLNLLKAPFIKFIDSMKQQALSSNAYNHDLIAVKVPGSFYYIQFLQAIFGRIYYIHVIRNGLDMAYSGNKNQLKNWGDMFDLKADENCIAKCQIRYWIAANNYAIDSANKYLSGTFKRVEFERLCTDKYNQTDQLLSFVGAQNKLHESFYDSISLPNTSGRYVNEAPLELDDDEIRSIKKLGFTI